MEKGASKFWAEPRRRFQNMWGQDCQPHQVSMASGTTWEGTGRVESLCRWDCWGGCSLMCPEHLIENLAHSICSIDNCGMNWWTQVEKFGTHPVWFCLCEAQKLANLDSVVQGYIDCVTFGLVREAGNDQGNQLGRQSSISWLRCCSAPLWSTRTSRPSGCGDFPGCGSAHKGQPVLMAL